MRFLFPASVIFGLLLNNAPAIDFTPAPQHFRQEVAKNFNQADGLPPGPVQLIDCVPNSRVRAFASGAWYQLHERRWEIELRPRSEEEFAFADSKGERVEVPIPSRDVRQMVRFGTTNWMATANSIFAVSDGKMTALQLPEGFLAVNQILLGPEGMLFLASSAGLFAHEADGWQRLNVADADGRAWAAKDVLGITLDSRGQLWFAQRAGVGCRTSEGWKFYEGKDGLPWNDFTGIAAGRDGEMWFGTRLGAIRFEAGEWHYRQGPAWLPNDGIRQIAVDQTGKAWFATAAGIGSIERRPMTLAEKAEYYEKEIQDYIKRTPFGFVAEAPLRKPADKSSADPQDSDNDGLWTAMYGAGECFAYAATKAAETKDRARKAFEALRFLQKVTQGGKPAPPPGFIARSIRPVDWPDPNVGSVERDRQEQRGDKLWKVLDPRWPKSADGKWFWKADTSSDELDGHFFFYLLYYDFCADTEAERERVRDVVRGITDHLITHDFVLIDHDGRPTRWAIYGPQFLNRDPNWWPERGLNSLSILSYLAVAAHITDDDKYTKASRELIDQHGYAQNAMYPKAQNGPGSGNQSDDEMAFMSYYSLLRCSKDEQLKSMIRYSFYHYWVNESPEMNPFFNFAYAGQNLKVTLTNQWGRFPLPPWPGWHEDSMATLYGLPLDRLNWPHKNSHRLDVVELPSLARADLLYPHGRRERGHRLNGKVVPVENRHFNHWNTDPWQLDYGGNGKELAAGTVFLLPYYMGVYHGFIELPKK